MNSRQKGKHYENIAAGFLEGRGFEILERNFYTRYGEIDIIARDRNTTAFVEVKYRSSKVFGEPFEAVDSRKRRRIEAAAKYYAAINGLYEAPLRFDVIEISGGDLKHTENAFGLTEV